jgi:hypothetical protein
LRPKQWHVGNTAMACREVIGFLDDYLDGKLPRRQRWAFKLHLLLCRHCRRYLASYATTIRLATNVGDANGDIEPIPEELVQAILAAKRLGGR